MELAESLEGGPHKVLAGLVGRYEGRARLWMQPDKLEDDEAVTGEIVALLAGQFVQHTYSTRIGGNDESGQALLGCALAGPTWQSAWIDSWHTGLEIMHLTGPGSDDVDVSTPYADGTWHWRTTYTATDDGLLIGHYNSGPDIPEYLSVEVDYTRL